MTFSSFFLTLSDLFHFARSFSSLSSFYHSILRFLLDLSRLLVENDRLQNHRISCVYFYPIQRRAASLESLVPLRHSLLLSLGNLDPGPLSVGTVNHKIQIASKKSVFNKIAVKEK